MCEFCELRRLKGSKKWWGKQGCRIDEFYLDKRICLAPDGREFDEKPITLKCIDEQYHTSYSLLINYCPMCGRKLKENE